MAAPSIRRADAADAAAIAAVAAATFPLACPPHTSPADITLHIRTYCTADALRAELTSDGTVFYVAEVDDGMVGFAMLVSGVAPPADVPTTTPIELRRIYVAEDHHGTGVAAALLARCVRHARTSGYDLMWLGTNQQNHRAVTFYGRSGFSIVGAKTFTVGRAVEHDHVMARPLDSATAEVPDPTHA